MFNLISNEKEKLKVINYFHFSTALQMCAVIGTIAAPLTLYSVELGLDPDRIGILGSLMAFCQVLALVSIPLPLYFGSKILSIWTLFSRYIFLLIFLIVPFYQDNLTLIGTTEVEVDKPDNAKITDNEINYLLNCVNNFFDKSID